MLALLALSPQLRRGREWLQDKLWSEKSPERGSISFRKTLHDLRVALGDEDKEKKIVISDGNSIRLNDELVEVCFEAAPGGQETRIQTSQPILLEGLEIPDPEFEDWLRDSRQKFENFAPGSDSKQSPRLVRSAAEAGRLLVEVADDACNSDSDQKRIIDHAVIQSVFQFAAEAVSLKTEVAPAARPPRDAAAATEDLLAKVASSYSGGSYRLAINVLESRDISSPASFSFLLSLSSPFHAQNDLEVARLQNRLLNLVMEQESQTCRKTEATRFQKSLKAIALINRMDEQSFQEADALLDGLLSEQKCPVLLAWRAFLRLCQAIECVPTQRSLLMEEAVEFSTEAVSLSRNNSFVLAIRGYVVYLTEYDFATAAMLCDRSIRLNSANCLAWATLGICQSHLGDPTGALKSMERARFLSASGPLQHVIDMAACLVEVKVGDFDRALRSAKISHTYKPNFLPPLRLLVPLSIWEGREQQAERYLHKIREKEASFSISDYRDSDYPTATLRSSSLIDYVPRPEV